MRNHCASTSSSDAIQSNANESQFTTTNEDCDLQCESATESEDDEIENYDDDFVNDSKNDIEPSDSDENT